MSSNNNKSATDGGQREENMLNVELVLGAEMDNPLRLPVSSSSTVDVEDGRLEIQLAGDGIDEYHRELGIEDIVADDGELVTDGGRNVVYRVTDKVGSTLPSGEYDDRDAALDRRAREMESHPDGDLVTVEKVEYLNSVGGDDA